ncbi:Oxygen-dependent choline dehydrogenase [Vibrio mediterranei]|uniref:Oxygen-dependent choline dehydrogenase n=1 Tax=Vibrio mediterranei TaxID=689 RepID=A0ABX5DAR8_9VIBR|nr:choline dehydrogenase [Vibrio mediterranei]PCD87205.1 choline dehydrogenase [Vibrio mediterranei]PRQ66790.1 choline dehydrogenase [Vibrio mediterranei]PTC06480.1 choline dehydrogenase [Vibrio mediterranei]SBO08930.1 Oxygen-dependent choline dehydrogenase [Vibrio mediterranei]
MEQRYDYIIVGAGSAGCVLADRLTESGEHSVLLLEAGGSDKSIFIQMPTALSYPMNTEKYAWQFETTEEAGLDGRKLHCPRGKVLGGSSSINGMVYVRGHACDFDQWEQQGAKGWNYQSCLPYFRRAESWDGGSDEYRGGDGPVGTCNGNNMTRNPLYQAFIDAGKEAGYPETQDYNGYQQEGFGPMHMTVDGGVRASTSNAYLKRALKRPNLTLIKGVVVNKVLLEAKQAAGVQYEKSGIVVDAKVNKEVISSAGSIGSVQLLQLSGIGPKKVLERAGVTVEHDLAGVGANLQDHLEVYFQYHCSQPITLNSKLGLVSKGLIGAEWILTRKGLGATNHFESCAFIRSRKGLKWPNIQYHFLPAAMRYDGQAAFDGHGFQVHVGPNKPESRGTVEIRSANPHDKPLIEFNYISTEQDRQDWRDCIRLTREILNQPAMDAYRGDEIQPGLHIQSDDAIDEWVKQNVESAYHPSCSCKMGADNDPLAVLDEQCRVRGIKALRVVDSSIFPTIPNGNLNGPTIMVAERAADIILGKPLQQDKQPVWLAPNWEQTQRIGSPLRELD